MGLRRRGHNGPDHGRRWGSGDLRPFFGPGPFEPIIYIGVRRASYTTSEPQAPRAEGRSWQHVAAGAAALAVGDLILGFAAFSSITLASLWYFSWEWIQLRAEYLAHGLPFGAGWQLTLAWFGVLVAFPLLALTILLAVRAMQLPRRVYRLIRGGVRPVPTPARRATRSVWGGIRRPDYVARFWAGGL